MKCIKYKDGKVTRVDDVKAESIVKQGLANYCPKSEWKTTKEVKVEVETKKVKKRNKKEKQ